MATTKSDAPVQEVGAEEEAPDIDKQWLPTVTTWGGLPNYGCPKCARDSLDFDELTTHIYQAHILPETTQGYRET